ncbi:hypothetical protein GLOIN_2v1766738 [Rhizophagus clarus]|uniref:Uncharacterized protein n=1 Tax=Rhizophagus clarus TaxID=94130 RepID=A0A8H3QC02_9GLOM|nr:hypothetical protein GLOIN_2v1766738 [Rhizophagus clarus]
MIIPNCMIHSSLGYAIKDISTIQLQHQVIRLYNQLQNKGLLEWKIYLKDLKIKYNLIASTLAIMYDNNLTCQSNMKRKIIGGQLPITQVLNPDLLFKDRLNYYLQYHNIYFLSQIMAADKICESRSKRKIANNRCLLFINKEKTINVKAQSIQDMYILDSLVFEYITMIENRIKYNTTNSQEASVRNTVKGQSSLTIYTDESFKRYSDTSIRMVKAHDSDDHSNIVDKLAKETYSKECLVIDPKLLVYNGSIYWNHKPIERNITLMVKDIKETQYIEQFLTLNRNRYFILLSDLESFDWSLTFRYIKDKFDDTFAFDSRFNFFKIKLHAKELPTQDNLCK